jgi:hypothetical protein
VGYKIYFYYLEIEADGRIQSKIEQISELDKELITIKIPILLPYHTDWANFERVDGEVTFKGKIFKYVKQKISKDTLILLCINDKEKTEISNQRDNYISKINDLASESNKKPTLKQCKTDYFESFNDIKFAIFSVLKTPQQSKISYKYPTGFTRNLEMPPRQLLINL